MTAELPALGASALEISAKLGSWSEPSMPGRDMRQQQLAGGLKLGWSEETARQRNRHHRTQPQDIADKQGVSQVRSGQTDVWRFEVQRCPELAFSMEQTPLGDECTLMDSQGRADWSPHHTDSYLVPVLAHNERPLACSRAILVLPSPQ